MLTFKKVIFSTISLILIFITVSLVVIMPYYNSEYGYYEDRYLRQSLAGKIDYITIGASHCLSGFDSKVLDENLNCNSYNLSVSMMTMSAKYELLKKEFSRNPIKTVVLELSYDTIQRDSKNEYAIGDEPMLTRFDNVGESLSYMIKNVALDDWLNSYSRSFVLGLAYWKDMLTHGNIANVDYTAKGYHAKESNNLTLSNIEVNNLYETESYSDIKDCDNLKQFTEIINLCHNNNARVIVAVVPVSDKLIWKLSNLNKFEKWAKNYCKDNNCEFYDFNLLKSRYELFNDKESFADDDHMSDMGAKTFTKAYSDIITHVDKKENIDSFFYDDYDSLKNDSPYMSIYKAEK